MMRMVTKIGRWKPDQAWRLRLKGAWKYEIEVRCLDPSAVRLNQTTLFAPSAPWHRHRFTSLLREHECLVQRLARSHQHKWPEMTSSWPTARTAPPSTEGVVFGRLGPCMQLKRCTKRTAIYLQANLESILLQRRSTRNSHGNIGKQERVRTKVARRTSATRAVSPGSVCLEVPLSRGLLCSRPDLRRPGRATEGLRPRGDDGRHPWGAGSLGGRRGGGRL